MNTLIGSFTAIFCYLAATSQVCLEREENCEKRKFFLLFGGCAALIHAFLLYQTIITAVGLKMSFFNAASLVTWVIALILLVVLWLKPVENLAVVLFPLAALSIGLAAYFPGKSVLPETMPMGMKIHIIFSILAYSLLCLSAFQALFVALQDHQLHNRHPRRVMQFLPPLQVMEDLLFQIILAGFLLLSLSLISGLMFVEDILGQHLAHKTVLSSTAWVIFALLIWGRWHYGWRGRTLILWNLGGFFTLMLSYFGTKLVLEFILQRV